METTPKAQNHILGLQKRGEDTDIDSKIPLDEICLSALSGRTAAGQPPLEFRHRELGRISTSHWSAWNIILGQFEAYIHLQEKVGTVRTVRSEQNQVSNTTAEQVHDEGCDRCRWWYRWWVGQSRTPIRVAVTSSDAGHDVKCKRTISDRHLRRYPRGINTTRENLQIAKHSGRLRHVQLPWTGDLGFWHFHSS